MDPNPNEIDREFPPLFRLYKNGVVKRFLGTDTVPAGLDPATSVLSKDVTIDQGTGVSARLYLPKLTDSSSFSCKIPLLVCIHGVEYRLAPEHPLPIGYDDTWAAIRWASSHSSRDGPEPWLNDHADFDRVYFAGESAGANIAHNMAMRVGCDEGTEGLKMKLAGLVLMHPFFGNGEKDELIEFLFPTCINGMNDPRLKPEKDPNLWRLGCRRVMVMVAEKDFLKDRGVSYVEALKKSGWEGLVEMVETEGEGHVFHLLDPTNDKSVELLKQFVNFVTCD